jgi:hypothetical protein
MLKIKLWWASLFIPKNSPYCHHNFKRDKLGLPSAKSCKYWTTKYDEKWKYQREYCNFLKRFLDLGDQIKDCGINDDWND